MLSSPKWSRNPGVVPQVTGAAAQQCNQAGQRHCLCYLAMRAFSHRFDNRRVRLALKPQDVVSLQLGVFCQANKPVDRPVLVGTATTRMDDEQAPQPQVTVPEPFVDLEPSRRCCRQSGTNTARGNTELTYRPERMVDRVRIRARKRGSQNQPFGSIAKDAFELSRPGPNNSRVPQRSGKRFRPASLSKLRKGRSINRVAFVSKMTPAHELNDFPPPEEIEMSVFTHRPPEAGQRRQHT